MSKKDRTLGFILMLFPLYIIYGFALFDYILRAYFGHTPHYTITGVLVIAFYSLIIVGLSYWFNFRYYYDFLLDRKNRKIVLNRGNIKKEYNIDDITIRVSFSRRIGTTSLALFINKDKFILRSGKVFNRNMWDTLFNPDKLAKQHANRIKNILGITDTTN